MDDAISPHSMLRPLIEKVLKRVAYPDLTEVREDLNHVIYPAGGDFTPVAYRLEVCLNHISKIGHTLFYIYIKENPEIIIRLERDFTWTPDYVCSSFDMRRPESEHSLYKAVLSLLHEDPFYLAAWACARAPLSRLPPNLETIIATEGTPAYWYAHTVLRSQWPPDLQFTACSNINKGKFGDDYSKLPAFKET